MWHGVEFSYEVSVLQTVDIILLYFTSFCFIVFHFSLLIL